MGARRGRVGLALFQTASYRVSSPTLGGREHVLTLHEVRERTVGDDTASTRVLEERGSRGEGAREVHRYGSGRYGVEHRFGVVDSAAESVDIAVRPRERCRADGTL